MFFFSVFARALDLGRAFPRKNCVFFLPSARIRVLPIFEKNSQFREIKKHSEKNKFILGDDKNIFPAMFFCCLFFFRRPHYFLKNRTKVLFIFSPSLTFPEICPMFFFISSPSLTFPKIGSMFFFS